MGLDIFFEKRKDIGYFRKVNFLVKYFADEGMGVEQQRPFEITREQVEQLLVRCKLVLFDPILAPIFLPTISGFFFGNTEYNDYYFQDVKEVEEYLEHTLLPEFNYLSDKDSIYFVIWY